MNTEWLAKQGAVILLKVLPLGAKLPKGGHESRVTGMDISSSRSSLSFVYNTVPRQLLFGRCLWATLP